MCVIIILPPKTMMNKRHFVNAVHNNWHGYGLVLKDHNDRVQLIKKFTEGGTDPEEVWKLLEDNKDIFRYLHLRHSTKGAQDETNVQPFEVYNSSSRQVFFMHNGTLTNFGGAYNNNVGKSDTLDFCEKILQPSLIRWIGDEGKADYTDELYWKLVMEKHWSGGSTGLFVSNDLEHVRIGSGWSEYKDPDIENDTTGVYVSNTSYFDKVQRGPYFLQLEAERKKKEEEERKEALKNTFLEDHSDNNKPNIKVTKWNSNKLAKDPAIIKAVNDLMEYWDITDPMDVSHLNNLTYEELLLIVEDSDPYTLTAFIEQMVDHLFDINCANSKLTESKLRAEKRLQEIAMKGKNEDGKSNSQAA